MGFLVLLVFEDDDAETDVTGGNQERGAGDTDQTELPGESETDDETTDEGGEGLQDTAMLLALRTYINRGRELTLRG